MGWAEDRTGTLGSWIKSPPHILPLLPYLSVLMPPLSVRSFCISLLWASTRKTSGAACLVWLRRHSFMLALTNSFTIEYLLCARHCSDPDDTVGSKTDKKSLPSQS